MGFVDGIITAVIGFNYFLYSAEVAADLIDIGLFTGA